VPQISYVIVGSALLGVNGRSVLEMRATLPWWDLPFPASILVFDLTPLGLLSLSGLSVLALLRWMYLLRTWIVSIPLLAVYHYVLAAASASTRHGAPLSPVLYVGILSRP
jgi:hypothetical protein